MTRPLTELSLFSGYGGFTLGLRLAAVPVRTVGYVEIDPYCQKIIQQRIADGYLDDAPIWPDISAFDGRQCQGLVDLVTGGFPCQDLSVAGGRAGLDGERSGLWWEMLRVIGEVRPRYVLLENVPGLLVRGVGRVLGSLAAVGYDAEWHLVPAAAVGAPHLRWRWWCLAYADNRRRFSGSVNGGDAYSGWTSGGTQTHGQDGAVAATEGQPGTLRPAEGERPGRLAGSGAHVPNTCGQGLEIRQQPNDERGIVRDEGPSVTKGSWWAVEPPLGRVVDGCPDRVGQLRALGNGIVPAVVARFLRGE